MKLNKSNLFYAIAGSVLLALLSGPSADAAKLGRILKDGTSVYQSPDGGSPVVGTLNRGDRVATSNTEKNGFYRVKSQSGLKGFVESRMIWFGKNQRARRGTRPEREQRPEMPTRRGDRRAPQKFSKVRMRVFSDLNMADVAEANALLSAGEITTMLGFGGELALALNPSFAVAMRLERIAKSVNDSNGVYSMTVASMPVMFGGQLTFLNAGSFSMDASIFGGLGLSTQMSSKNITTNAQAVVGGTPFTFLGKLNMNLAFGDNFMLFAEGGYRLLKLPETIADPFQAGTLITSSSARSVTMSSPVVGFGLGLKF